MSPILVDPPTQREEVRSHALSLCCTHVVGYKETCCIHDDVCILSCEGTAATLRNLLLPPDHLMALDARLLARRVTDADKAQRTTRKEEEEEANRRPEDDEEGEDDEDEEKCGVRRANAAPDQTGQSPHPGIGDEAGGDEEAAGGGSTAGGLSSSPRLVRRAASAEAGDGSPEWRLPGGGRAAGPQGGGKRTSSGRRHGRLGPQHPAGARRPVGATTRSTAKPPPLRLPKFRPCSLAHVPYNHSLAPFARMKLVPCAMCGRKW